MEGMQGMLIPRKLLNTWSGRRDSNPRRPAWEAGILPLNYSRSVDLRITYSATCSQLENRPA